MNQPKFYFFCLLTTFLFLFGSCKKDQTKNEEQQELKQLFTKIRTLAESSTCGGTTNHELKSISYGSKACGGPNGYLAYSTSINTVEFERLITEYAALEKAYNKKWGITSTCDITPTPVTTICDNGKPKLVYGML
ncbi:MAG: hypothetical protein EOO98_03300 [Pedobacter sp.]|nr:MAG: hypothetical protein EOO98_03300 [Pedobacter sp.]